MYIDLNYAYFGEMFNGEKGCVFCRPGCLKCGFNEKDGESCYVCGDFDESSVDPEEAT
jgi:hypothetical protein